MSGYLDNFVGYFLNFFKKDNRTSASNPTACSTPPRRINRTSASDPTACSTPPRCNNRTSASDPTACSTPPRRSNTVIENRRLKEDIAKQKSMWTSTAGEVNFQIPHYAHDSYYSNNFLHNPETYGHFLNQNEADTKQANERGDGLDSPRCYKYHDAATSREYQFVLPPCTRRQQRREQPSYSLRRSFSLESCCPTEDKRRLSSRKMLQMRHNLSPIGHSLSPLGHNLSPIDNAGGMCLSLDPDKDYTPLKLIDLTPSQQSESSSASANLVVEDHQPKPSKIPTYRRKHRPAKISKSLPKPFERTESKEPACLCFREVLARPIQKGYRAEGHAFYCPRSVIAYRSYLNTKLENLFRVISKKKYCGNIIDAASHSRWMKLADVGVDEDATCFRKFAKGQVVLPISEYKKALKSICSEKNLDYWDLLKIMTDIEIGSGDSNSTINGWKGSSN